MLRILLLLSAVLLAAARVDVVLHSCLDMSVKNKDAGVEFSVSFNEEQGSGARLLPVLGFESYHDGRLGQRGSCSNVREGTTAAQISSAAQYTQAVTANGWVRSVANHVVTYRRTFAWSELQACLDYTSQPVLGYQADGDAAFSGTLYIALVQLGRADDGSVVDFARYVQPHQFRLSSQGTVLSVSGMEFGFDLAWVGNTWTPSGDVLVQLESLVSPLGAASASFDPDTVEIVAESGEPMTLMVLSDCDAAVSERLGECSQDWYLRSASLEGRYRLSAQLASSAGPGMLVTAMLDLELQSGELHTEQRGVQGTLFRDEDMSVPYLSTALNDSSVVDGDTVCVMLQDNSGSALTARAARLCTSSDMDLRSQSGDANSGCNTPGATGVIEAMIFDNDKNDKSSTFAPLFKTLERASQQAFCFTVKKLSENNHIVEVEYYSEGGEGQRTAQNGARGLLSFEWDNRQRCPREMYVDCPRDCDWNRGHGSCQRRESHYSSGGVWLWAIFIFFLIVVCIAAFGFTGYDDHHGYTHPAYAHSYGHGGDYQSHNRSHRSTNTYQQQQHHNSHNTYNTYQHFDDRDVVDVDGSASLDDNDVERMRQRRAREQTY
jgi:hypothetical protein